MKTDMYIGHAKYIALRYLSKIKLTENILTNKSTPITKEEIWIVDRAFPEAIVWFRHTWTKFFAVTDIRDAL